MTIKSDIQKLEPGALVELFELDARAIGGGQNYFHSGVNGLGASVVWQGKVYAMYPIEAEGFEATTKGTLPTPTLRVANATGLVGAMCNDMDDLLGARVIRRRTFAKYLDAANFPEGNPSADPLAHFPEEVWRVSRKINENKLMVEFELSSSLDTQGIMLPRRQIIANVCTWKYRSPECSYAGENYFTINDEPTTDPQLDRCAKRPESCVLRFGETAVLPYGGFPAAGRLR